MTPPYNCITNILATADVDSWFPSTVTPVVADDTVRDTMFPSPGNYQRVENIAKGYYEQYDTSLWRPSIGSYLPEGIDAVVWMVRNKLRDSVSVTDYLSDAERANTSSYTGTIDVSSAFAKARAVSSVILVPKGKYYVPTLELSSNDTTIVGDGADATILTGTASSYINISATESITFANLTLDTWSVALLVSQTTLHRIAIENTEFRNCGRVLSDRTNSTVTIDPSKTVSNLRFVGNTIEDSEKGISLCCLVQNAFITSNEVRNLNHASRAYAFLIGSEDGTDTVYNSYGIAITNNIIDGVHTTDLNAETHGIFLFAKRSIVEGNIISNVSNSNSSSVNGTEGIYCKAPDSIVCFNQLTDAGLGQGAITLKNKFVGTIKSQGNVISYINTTALSSPNFLTGVYASEMGSFESINDTVIGAQVGIRAATSEGLQLPKLVRVKGATIEGDIQVGVLHGPAEMFDIDDIVVRQTEAVSSRARIAVQYAASSDSTDIGSYGPIHCYNTYAGIVIGTSGGATIASINICGGAFHIDNSIVGSRAVSWGAGVQALGITGADFTPATAKLVGTPPASFVLKGNLGLSRQDEVGADVGNANVTLNALTSAGTQIFATTLTTNRTVTFPNSMLYNGLRYTVIRTGLGTGTLTIGSAATIPSNTAAVVTVVYNGSAWMLTHYQTLPAAGMLIGSPITLNNGAGANTGTLTNAPVSGNPTKWISIDDNGTTRYIPAW